MRSDSPQGVSPHYLDRVVATAQAHEVQASEDIIAGNGIKLLAKGARIDAGVRDRLLQHKLRRPLEECVSVTPGVIPAGFEPVAENLLSKHALLRALCVPDDRLPALPKWLGALTLSLPVQSLLSIYAQEHEDRNGHAVGVAMLATSLARRLLPGESERHRTLAVAGLVHDIGELYIDPAYLRRDVHLGVEQWRHIVTHPLVGHRVLCEMAGAGPAVAGAVLLHHERLDGFGYPRSVGGDTFVLDGQILAAAEWLMALAESGASPLTRAGMAARLIPGEFNAALLETVSMAARRSPDTPVELASAPRLEQAVPRIARLAGTLQRFRGSLAWIDGRIAQAKPALRAVLEIGLQRMLRIQASFSSTGLDAHSPKLLLAELAALGDPGVYTEIMMLIGELEWRMRELEREQRLRADQLQVPDRAVIVELIDRIKGTAGV
ncbi:MAG TPA: HD domain-containing phosphohydrolase [Albitalea sp.]|nr:HD domain-containing phosphohydrolase [Albitalea sp.]